MIVDEAQDFSANQVRAILRHLQDLHSTTFVLDAIQRIYPQFFKWSEVGIKADPEMSYRLKENHRNTAAIAAFALRLLTDSHWRTTARYRTSQRASRPGAKPLVVAGRYSAQLTAMLDRLKTARPT